MDMQKQARKLVREYLDDADETSREFAVRCGICKATLFRFLGGEDVSMGVIERMLGTLGYRLDIVRADDPDSSGAA